jgi:hypothetical protein
MLLIDGLILPPLPPGIQWQLSSEGNRERLRIAGTHNGQTVGQFFNRTGGRDSTSVIRMNTNTGIIHLFTAFNTRIVFHVRQISSDISQWDWESARPFLEQCVQTYGADFSSLHWMFTNTKSHVRFIMNPDNHFANLTLRFPDTQHLRILVLGLGNNDDIRIEINFPNAVNINYNVQHLPDGTYARQTDSDTNVDDVVEDNDEYDFEDNQTYNNLEELENNLQDMGDAFEEIIHRRKSELSKQVSIWGVMSKVTDLLITSPQVRPWLPAPF